MSALPELRQRRKPEEEESEEEEDSPVLVEREDEDDDEVEEEAEEEQDDEDKKREDALTRRLQGGFAKTPLEPCCGERPGAMKVPKKRRRAAGSEGGEKGGIKWMPIIFLLFMMGPALFTAMDYLMQLPIFKRFRGPPNYRQCLTDFYRRVHPERLQEVDIGSILRKYKGKEDKLARNLETRYGRKFKCP